MARKRTARQSGNGRTEFTITHRQSVNIKYDLKRGRSASFTWLPFGGGSTTERHPTEVIIEGINTGTVFNRDSKGGSRSGSTSQTLQPDTYVIYGRGAGEGDDRSSDLSVTVTYEEGTEQSDDGEKQSFAGLEVANMDQFTPQPIKNLADDLGVPSVALMGGLALVIWLVFFN